MPDRKPVIEGMEQFKKCLIDTLWFHGTYVNWEPFDACLDMLKEKKVTVEIRQILVDDSCDGPVFDTDKFYHCPECNKVLSRTYPNKDIHFCYECGRAVKWD